MVHNILKNVHVYQRTIVHETESAGKWGNQKKHGGYIINRRIKKRGGARPQEESHASREQTAIQNHTVPRSLKPEIGCPRLKSIPMSKAGESNGGFGDDSLVEELDESFAQDRQSTGHSLFRASECGAEVVNPLSGCQERERKLEGGERERTSSKWSSPANPAAASGSSVTKKMGAGMIASPLSMHFTNN
jgi:hypothetical protein